MKPKLLVLCMNILLIITCYFFIDEGTGFIKWMNALFYITILNVIFFLYLFITKGKFFDGIVSSFQTITRNRENASQKLLSETIRRNTYDIAKFNFTCLVTFSVIFQIVYVLT